MALRQVTSHNYKEFENQFSISLSPIFLQSQKMETENRLLKDQVKRLKLEMIQLKPGVDLNAIMSDGRKQRFLDQDEESNKL